jgi:HAD superfamily phosphoserine phosphatase-like hydrolase
MVTVIIPALNEAARIGSVIELAWNSPMVRQVIVVDDGSVDDTPDIARLAGADVITSSLLGKGASMLDGLRVASEDVVLYLDGDLTGLREDLVDVMTAPLLNGQADFTKATFSRSAGRVTILTARPLLQVFFPELAHFSQPLGGIMAASRGLLERLHFETDYGVDLGLLIDAHEGGARILEVDIGHLEHDSQTLEALGNMAKQVVRTLLMRAERFGRLGGNHVREIEEVERHAQAEVALSFANLGSIRRLAIFDMDGTLLKSRFIKELAVRTRREDQLAQWLDNHRVTDCERARQIARIFAGVPKEVFVETARDIELTPGASETVVALRKAGFRVGIVTDSYVIAAETVRRRVFADFSVANLVRFSSGLCSGELTPCPLFAHDDGCPVHTMCKYNVLLHLLDRLQLERKNVVAVGDGMNDICMLAAAGVGVAFEPKAESVRESARFGLDGDLRGVLALAGV